MVDVRPPLAAEEWAARRDRLRANRVVGLASFQIVGDGCEVIAIDQRRGVGRALMDEIAERAWAASCRRVWLTTTNDNIPALAFYQKWGMDLVGFRRDAVTEARRRLKPTIPDLGYGGIPLKHELELELIL